MKKKLAVLVLFALSACGEKSDPAPDKGTSTGGGTKTETPKPAPKTPDADKPVTKAPDKDLHVDERKISRDPKVYDQFCETMESIGAAHKALKKDIAAKKEEAVLKAYLKTILEAGRKARALKYLKDDEKNEDLETYFEIFDLKMNQFLEDDWGEDKAEGNFERLGSTCRTCHELWRD